MAASSSNSAKVLAENRGFVRRDGLHFLLNGQRIHVAGANSYYQMIHRRTGHAGADEILDEMQARSMTVLRTWAFQDEVEQGGCLQCAPHRRLGRRERPIDFIDSATLMALDQTLAAADARGIRVVLTLVNNWDDYGGMNRYTVWRYGSVRHDAFYTDSTIRGWFKDFIALLVHRVNTVNGRMYRDEPTIFAWQLANEARSSWNLAGALNDWIGEMSAYIKSVDPNHMVSTGIEGFYNTGHAECNTDLWMCACGQDFIDNHLHPSVDYASCHIWPLNWGWDPIGHTTWAMAKARQFLQQRIDHAHDVLGKPLMVDEYGVPRDNHGTGPSGGPTTVRERFFQDLYYASCEASASSGGPLAGTALWMILDDATASWDDGNGVFLPQDVALDAIISAHARRLSGVVDLECV
ncbi:MAG: cellulase family glycosylhydrolase [Phycisphaerae bacterium]|nr:cellulase family glycosylhydrolase [Phycisphaerae bacterium]